MVPSIYGENMFDDFFDNSFFGGHSPLFGKHERNLMKTDIREMSVVKIETPDTYDEDGYPIENGLMDPHLGVIDPSLKCRSCGSAWEYVESVGQFYLHSFSRKQPDLNWDNPKVREEVFKMMTWWCDKGIEDISVS